MLVKNAASAKNARSRKVTIKHGYGSGLLRTALLDRRSKLGKMELQQIQELTAQIGGDPSPAMAAMITHRARVHILVLCAWQELNRRNLFSDEGEPVPALDAYLRLVREDRELLRLIGLTRVKKPVPSLTEYLHKKAQEASDD